MKKTWEFTRFYSMFFRYLETLFYIIISQTGTFTYFAMIYSMYTNAGLITWFYPMSIFGYALLNEVRPSYQYWRVILTYSIIILTIKFICSLDGIRDVLEKPCEKDQTCLKTWINYAQLGIVDYKQDFGQRFNQILPELLIICLIMLNEIKLKLLGLYWVTELEIESVNEGIQRTLCQGDEEEAERRR
jgi:hypothetical protein